MSYAIRLTLFFGSLSIFHLGNAEVKYRVEELAAPPESEIRTPQIGGHRINNNGQILANVSGYLPDGRGASRTYLYENGVPHRLEVSNTNQAIIAVALNNNGMTACEQYVNSPTLEFEYLVHDNTKYVRTINPKKTISVYDLADDGTFVGTYDILDAGGRVIGRQPATYKDGVRTPLPTFGGLEGYAYGTNNRGQIVGSSNDETGYGYGCIWENGSIRKLTRNGVRLGPRVISDAGWIGGTREINADFDKEVFTMLGDKYIAYTVSNEFQYFLSGINDSGVAVCTRIRRMPFIHDGALVFSGGQAELLEDISDAKALGWSSLTGANDINNRGEIVGWGVKNGKVRGYIARPVPEPAGLLALGLGLLAISRRPRRQSLNQSVGIRL